MHLNLERDSFEREFTKSSSRRPFLESKKGTINIPCDLV
jgi:hypothetical protein